MRLTLLINGLLRVTGRGATRRNTDHTLNFEFSKAFCDLYAPRQLWQQLGFDAFRRVFRSFKRTLDVEFVLWIMVFNRLSNPGFRAPVVGVAEVVQFPDGDTRTVGHHHLAEGPGCGRRAKDAVEEILATTLCPLIDQELSVVFYDLTTVIATRDTNVKEEIWAYGRSKDGGAARQVVIRLIQTAEGLPLSHEVFEGNVWKPVHYCRCWIVWRS
ncbi:MAG: hypothetical protein IPM37_18615 [Hahellaceae bacterium]|nr:hypothetical protein [Hahellaceae bacterium]